MLEDAYQLGLRNGRTKFSIRESSEEFWGRRRAENVALFERPPFDRSLVAVDEIVVGDGYVARPRQRFAGVRADIACAAGDQYVRHVLQIIKSTVSSGPELRRTVGERC